jgi:hypothetical protein
MVSRELRAEQCPRCKRNGSVIEARQDKGEGCGDSKKCLSEGCRRRAKTVTNAPTKGSNPAKLCSNKEWLEREQGGSQGDQEKRAWEKHISRSSGSDHVMHHTRLAARDEGLMALPRRVQMSYATRICS